MPRQITLTNVSNVVLTIYPGGQVIASYRILAGTEEVRTVSNDITDLLTSGQVNALAVFRAQIQRKLEQREVE